MKKRFIIAIDTATSPDIAKIHEKVIGPLKGAWWHWLNNLWLLSLDTDVTAGDIAKNIREAAPHIDSLVMELRSDGTETWAANCEAVEKTNEGGFTSWLRKFWDHR